MKYLDDLYQQGHKKSALTKIQKTHCVVDGLLAGAYEPVVHVREDASTLTLQRQKCCRNASGEDLRGEWKSEGEHAELVCLPQTQNKETACGGVQMARENKHL